MKRKAASCAASGKRFKASYNSLDDLPWKTVARPLETCLDGDDGVLDLEEVNNVEIVYENTYRGRVVKFNVRSRIMIMANEFDLGPGTRRLRV